jgi:hypothetical protein
MAIIPEEIKKEIAVETPQQQRAKNMIYLLVIIVLITASVLYFGFKEPSVSSPSEVAPVLTQEASQYDKILEALKNTELKNPVFKDKKFESLILNGQLPISIGTKGRPDPFAAF